MKNGTLLQTLALFASFFFLCSTSPIYASGNSFAVNEMTSNLWSFVPSNGGSWDTVKGQLHYLPGKSGFLFFVGSDEELDFLKAIGSEIDELYPNSRILGMESVIPLTYLEIMSDGTYNPLKIDFIDENKTVVASWDFAGKSWTYYNDFDENGSRMLLNSNGTSRTISDDELIVYSDTPYEDLIVKSGPQGDKVYAMAAAMTSSTSGDGEFHPHSKLGEAAMKKKVPEKLSQEIEAAKEKGYKPGPRTGLMKAATDPKTMDFDKALRRAKFRGRIFKWGIPIVVLGTVGGVGIYAYFKNKALEERNAERRRMNEERQQAAETKQDSLSTGAAADTLASGN